MGAAVEDDEPRGVTAIREHGSTLARVCMALLGDAAEAERALERIAADAGAALSAVREGAPDDDVLVQLMTMARKACADRMSKLPIRTLVPRPASRAALGMLRPTEREAVVLHMIGGLDAAQVARACSIDLDTARSRIARAVSQLVEEEKKR